MRARNQYMFSAPALQIDFRRIVDEARETARDSDDFDTLPSLIRVQIEGGHVVTLCHREILQGALLNQPRDVQEKLLTANAVDVNDTIQFATLAGEDGLVGQDAAFVQHSDWVAFQGDFVKELSNRRTCIVEVF